ncbi:MAG TPA: TlpA disulfide reductase family protein [Flavobacteriaceae bacterium]|nr:TlpA disulfide reductase family protein [Flavobacteriaceae bacterium]
MKKLLYCIAFLPTLLMAQHTVSGVFSPAKKFTYAFLYHATPTGTNYIGRSKIETDGNFTIALDSTATPGIYKIVYAVPVEDNNFDFIYNGKEDIFLTFDLDKGLDFKASNENKLWSSYTKSMELVNKAISNFYTKGGTEKNAFKDIFKTLKETQEAYEDAAKGTLALTFIKANRPYIPTSFEDISTYSKNLKRTFLQHVDFENPLLQSSDFLTDRLLSYVFGMANHASHEDYKNDIDHLVELMAKANATVKTSLLQIIWQHFADANNEAMANYVTDTYLLNLAKEIGYSQLVEILTSYKNNSIGNRAQNFDIKNLDTGKTTTLYDLTGAERYLIIFWSSTCSHCAEELPKVKTIIPEDTKVVAIGLEDSIENWQKEIKNYPAFIHVLGLEKWDNPIAKAYNVNATPSYILLDKDKNIIAKPYDLEALKKALK